MPNPSTQFFSTLRKALIFIGGIAVCITSGFCFRGAFNRADTGPDLLVSLCIGVGVALICLGSALIQRVVRPGIEVAECSE